MEPDEYDIQKYLHADAVIDRLRQKRIETAAVVYDRTLETHIEFDDQGVHVVAPRVENLVCDSIEACQSIDDAIHRWHLRRVWFNRWLSGLDENPRYMITHYPQFAPQSIKDEAQNELREIETAVAFQCGYEPPQEHIEIPPDPIDGVNAMAELFGGDY